MKQMLSVPLAFEQETGIRPDPSTCWRWATKGVQGVVLETWVLGGRRVTTLEAVHHFIEQRTLVTGREPVKSETRIWLDQELARR